MRIKNGFYYGSVAIRLCSWYFISITCSYLSLFFTTAIIIDLYKLLTNPFSSTEARIRKYIVIAFASAMFFSAFGLGLALSQNKRLSTMNVILFLVISIANMVLCVVTMVFVFVRFRTKGMSSNIKD